MTATMTATVRFARHHLLTAYALLALAYLLVPIAVVVLFSFNSPNGRFNYTWQGFTLKNWGDPFGVPGLWPAMQTSLEIAALAALGATVLGTLIALALVRYGFRGRGAANLFIFLPMATPEIVMGASLLSLFLAINFQTGFWTIVIAHITFDISYVVTTVRARLVGFDRHLEEAAMDLYANSWTTFWRVTLPLIAPGVLSALLLSFALSIDDFVITNFNSGTEVTFPLFVWGAARVGVPPQVNVVGSIIFFAAIGLMLLNVVRQRRPQRAAAPATATATVS